MAPSIGMQARCSGAGILEGSQWGEQDGKTAGGQNISDSHCCCIAFLLAGELIEIEHLTPLSKLPFQVCRRRGHCRQRDNEHKLSRFAIKLEQ